MTNYWGLFFFICLPVFAMGCILGGCAIAAIANRSFKATMKKRTIPAVSSIQMQQINSSKGRFRTPQL